MERISLFPAYLKDHTCLADIQLPNEIREAANAFVKRQILRQPRTTVRFIGSEIEIPTLFRSAYDVNGFGIEMNGDVPIIVPEHPYASPIWDIP